MPAPARTVRAPVDQPAFDRLPLKPSTFPLGSKTWHRLARTAYPNQFFASPGSRFTPSSRTFPCVYLCENQETAVAEVWGDRIYAHRKLGHRIYTIVQSEAQQWQFLRVRTLPPLKLCDFTNDETLLTAGIDAATLYDTNLAVPQSWAEAVARHPEQFDGILYRSRHTLTQLCIVAWVRATRALDKEFEFEPDVSFLNSAPAYALATRMQMKLTFAA